MDKKKKAINTLLKKLNLGIAPQLLNKKITSFMTSVNKVRKKKPAVYKNKTK